MIARFKNLCKSLIYEDDIIEIAVAGMLRAPVFAAADYSCFIIKFFSSFINLKE